MPFFLLEERPVVKIDEQLVRKIALLARLDIPEDEIGTMREQLQDILSYFETLGELDTDEVPSAALRHTSTNVFREDEVRESFSRSVPLEQAPESYQDYFRTPRVVEGESP